MKQPDTAGAKRAGRLRHFRINGAVLYYSFIKALMIMARLPEKLMTVPVSITHAHGLKGRLISFLKLTVYPTGPLKYK